MSLYGAASTLMERAAAAAQRGGKGPDVFATTLIHIDFELLLPLSKHHHTRRIPGKTIFDAWRCCSTVEIGLNDAMMWCQFDATALFRRFRCGE